jgi:ribosomal protein S18 acetylase RimI-like enzyme
MGHQSFSNVIIRRAQFEDLAALEWEGRYRHYRRLYRDVFDSSLRGEAILWVVDESSLGLIGQLFVQLKSTRLELADGGTIAYIYGFRVKDEYRGNGLGSRLLKFAEDDLIQRRFQYANLNVNRDNLAARRFYERKGYVVVAREAGRWSYRDHLNRLIQVNEPAWRMQKKLVVFNNE